MKGSPFDNKALLLREKKLAVQLICLSLIVMNGSKERRCSNNVSREKERDDANERVTSCRARAIEY